MSAYLVYSQNSYNGITMAIPGIGLAQKQKDWNVDRIRHAGFGTCVSTQNKGINGYKTQPSEGTENRRKKQQASPSDYLGIWHLSFSVEAIREVFSPTRLPGTRWGSFVLIFFDLSYIY